MFMLPLMRISPLFLLILLGKRCQPINERKIKSGYYRGLSGSHRFERKETHHLSSYPNFPDPDPQAAPGAMISYHEMLNDMRGNKKLLAQNLNDYSRFVVIHSAYGFQLLQLYQQRFYRKEKFTRKQSTARALRSTGGLLAGMMTVRDEINSHSWKITTASITIALSTQDS
jgi:hypothetical protein